MKGKRVGKGKRKYLRLSARMYRISASKSWTPWNSDQRFNFSWENPYTSYLGQDLEACYAEAIGKLNRKPKETYWATAKLNLVIWDLREPASQIDQQTALKLQDPLRHYDEVRSLASIARREGVQGIIYHSTQMPGKKKVCLVVFLKKEEAGKELSDAKFKRGKWELLRASDMKGPHFCRKLKI